jgi:uncharacterized protein (TIGR03382 family)
MVWRATWALAMLAASLGATAHANGRPALTSGVAFQRTDSRSLYIRTTFGLLISHDDGCSFRWTCEDNVGYGGMYDPTYAIADDGALYATSFTGLRVSRDGGCSFATATSELAVGDPGRIADRYVAALDLAATGEIWVATADTTGSNDVYVSTDHAGSFASRGPGVPTMSWNGIAVAPADPMRVYASGSRSTPAADAGMTASVHLMTTADGGQTWAEADLGALQLANPPAIAIGAIDPVNPRRLFVISVGANPPDGDRLYRSIDGGGTFTEVLATSQPISSVAIPDASTVLVAGGAGGSFRSDDGGATFGPLAGAPQLACLGVAPDGRLVGCAANWDPDFMAVTVSTDATHWQKLLRFVELDGPLACPGGTAGHDVCDTQKWPNMCASLGAAGPTCPTATDLAACVDGVPVHHAAGCCGASSPSDGAPVLAAAGLALSRRTRRRRR